MAARFWVGGTGDWDAADTTHWAATSGGAGGQSVPGASDDVTFDGNSGGGTVTVTATQSVLSITSSNHTGTLNTNGQSVSSGSWVNSGTATRTVTLGSSTITISGANGVVWNTNTVTNLTFNANTSTILFTGTSPQLSSSGSITFNTVTFTGSGTVLCSGITCANLTKTGTTNKTDILSLSGDPTITGTLTLSANSDVNRIQVSSNTVGTARIITAASVVIANIVDFMDITGAGAATWTVAGTGANALGDAGGNSGITFTSSSTQTWSGTGGGNWSANAWTTRVPLPQDDVVVSGAVGNITTDMPRLGRDMNFSGHTGTGRWDFSTTASTIFGSVTCPTDGLMTSQGTQSVNLRGRGTHTITSNGMNFATTGGVNITAPGGTYTLLDAFSCSATTLTINNGAFVDGGFATTVSSFSSSNTNTRVITLTGVVSLTGTSGTIWNFSTTSGLTFTGSACTMAITSTSASARTMQLGAQTFGGITYTIAGSTGQLNISTTGTTTITTINFSDTTNARTLQFQSGRQYNVTTFNVNGGASRLISLVSGTGGSAFTLSKSSGIVSCDYLSIQDSTATGGATWYAGANSTNVSGNTGWLFQAAPSQNYRSTSEAMHDWYMVRSGRPNYAPLNDHKSAYYISKGFGGATKPLSQMEREWLQNVGSTSSIRPFELWVRACQAQGVTPGKSVNECMFKFFTSVAGNP